MFYHFSWHIQWHLPAPSRFIESRMSIGNFETVFNDCSDFCIGRNIGELHVFTVPMQFLIQSLQSHGKNTHYNHFVERTCFRERRGGFNTISGALFTSTHPIHFVRNGNFALCFRRIGLATRYQPRIFSVATAN